MIDMKRIFLLGALAPALAVANAPAASATIIELGAVPSAPLTAPVCPPGKPQNCKIVLSQVTALQTVRNGVGYPTKVQQAGLIVAFRVGLSALSSNRNLAHTYIHDLDQSFHGTTRVAITVLAPSGAGRLHRFKDVEQSPYYHVQPYLGQVVQIPLQTALPVFRGDVIALTTSTWAPVLTILLPQKSYFYRQSRQKGCNTNPPPEPQSVGLTTKYVCAYTGTRVEYSATEVTNPVATSAIKS